MQVQGFRDGPGLRVVLLLAAGWFPAQHDARLIDLLTGLLPLIALCALKQSLIIDIRFCMARMHFSFLHHTVESSDSIHDGTTAGDLQLNLTHQQPYQSRLSCLRQLTALLPKPSIISPFSLPLPGHFQYTVGGYASYITLSSLLSVTFLVPLYIAFHCVTVE